MHSLLFRNLLFTILKPGIVVGLIPYLILNRSGISISSEFKFYQFSGILVFFLGVAIVFICILMFAIDGKGTLSPLDPTKELVTGSLYRYSRNPMYIGVLIILLGESIFFNSRSLWIYLILIFFLFNLFIFLLEEPRLKRDFGDAYLNYCKKVKRWI